MGFELRYLPLALQDIDDAAQYLSQFYPGTASKVLRKMQQQLAQLAEYPELYEVYEQDGFYRKMPVSQYAVFYHVNVHEKTVDIHRVLRATWNFPHYLEEIETE